MRHTNRVTVMILAMLMGLATLTPRTLLAHCQIPCGIYDDHMRLQSMLEDAATIEKAIQMMNSLEGKKDLQSQNQMVRWIMNKEEHSQMIIETISDYYLTQRVKPEQKDYLERLQKHHAVILAAMKTKQNTDIQFVVDLQKNIQGLIAYYPEHQH